MKARLCSQKYVPAGHRLTALCLQAGECLTHIGQPFMLLQNSKAGESLAALIASPLSITLTWGQGMIDREALGQPVHLSNRSILQVSLPVTHSILSQLSPVTSLRNLLHKVLLLENCLWWSAAIYHGPEIRGNSLTLHIAEQSSVIYSTIHSCQTRRLSLPPTRPQPPPQVS